MSPTAGGNSISASSIPPRLTLTVVTFPEKIAHGNLNIPSWFAALAHSLVVLRGLPGMIGVVIKVADDA